MVLVGVLIVAMSASGVPVGLALRGHAPPAPDGAAMMLCDLAFAFISLMSFSTALSFVAASFIDRGDIDLLLGSPLPLRRLLTARLAATALRSAALWLFLFGPPVVAVAVIAGPRWLGGLALLIDAGLFGTTVGSWLAVSLFRAVGAQRVKTVTTLITTLSGLSVGLATPLYTNVFGAPKTQPSSWLSGLPARVLFGDIGAAAILSAATLALFLATTWLLAPSFARVARHGDGRRRRFAGMAPLRGFGGKLFPLLLLKDCRLLLRNHALLMQILARSIAFIPLLVINAGRVRRHDRLGPVGICRLSADREVDLDGAAGVAGPVHRLAVAGSHPAGSLNKHFIVKATDAEIAALFNQVHHYSGVAYPAPSGSSRCSSERREFSRFIFKARRSNDIRSAAEATIDYPRWIAIGGFPMIRPFQALACALFVLPASAETVLHLDQQAQKVVSRDRLRADLRVEASGSDSRAVQDDVNRRMAAALAKARKSGAVTVQSGGYSVYKASEVKGPDLWHASQGLTLISKDFDAVLKLSGDLQGDGLAMSGLRFFLAPETLRAAQSDLSAQALQDLRDRAGELAADLGMSVVQYKDITVGNAIEAFAGVRPMMMRAKAAPLGEVASPEAEAGDSTISLSVQAEVVLGDKPR